MGGGYYILDGKMAVPVKDADEWARGYDLRNRHVGDTIIGGCRISTIFLGIDHNWGEGLPLLFETMIFRGAKGREQWRCGNWQEAEAQHKEAVELVRREIKEKVND